MSHVSYESNSPGTLSHRTLTQEFGRVHYRVRFIIFLYAVTDTHSSSVGISLLGIPNLCAVAGATGASWGRGHEDRGPRGARTEAAREGHTPLTPGRALLHASLGTQHKAYTGPWRRGREAQSGVSSGEHDCIYRINITVLMISKVQFEHCCLGPRLSPRPLAHGVEDGFRSLLACGDSWEHLVDGPIQRRLHLTALRYARDVH